MAFSPEDSAIKVNQSLEEQIFNAKTHYEVAEILRQAAVDQHLVKKDLYSPEILLPVDPVPGTPKAHAKTVTIAGKTHVFEAATEAEADAQLLAFFRQNFGNQPTEQPAERPRDSDTGRFVAARTDDPVAAADLELKFKRGELSSQEYLEQSGAIRTYLESQGVPIEELRASVEEKQDARVAKSWQDATAEFLNSSSGQDWPGGPQNLKTMQVVLQRMNAADNPSVDNLALAYEYMKQHDLVAENPELTIRAKISEARSPEELRSILHSGSSVFGR